MKKEWDLRYREIHQNNGFLLADISHVLNWNIGLDDDGNKALKLRGAFNLQTISGTKFMNVRQYSNGEQQTILFSLLDNELDDQFFYFVDDLIESTRNCQTDSQGYNCTIENYLRWKKMFQNKPKELLSETQIMGLIAEVLFLKRVLIPKYGTTIAVHSWSGQKLTHKDFSLDDTWYEIKAVSMSKNEVHISSLEQLNSNKPGELVIFKLEKMSSEYDGIKLNNLILDTADSILETTVREDFLGEVSRQGFALNERYDDYVYRVSDPNHYTVNDDFPKLIPDGTCTEITKAEYWLSIPQLEKYRVSI